MSRKNYLQATQFLKKQSQNSFYWVRILVRKEYLESVIQNIFHCNKRMDMDMHSWRIINNKYIQIVFWAKDTPQVQFI